MLKAYLFDQMTNEVTFIIFLQEKSSFLHYIVFWDWGNVAKKKDRSLVANYCNVFEAGIYEAMMQCGMLLLLG